ncbi:hypothetical protein BX666DRAFT_1389999 [Dichotomocladium elegans]|nr:hypothetical protein BX666DRAFT_1389999 [Dichotomocladium elegans]
MPAFEHGCLVCSSKFKTTTKLNKHMKDKHLEMLALECSCCNKAFSSRRSIINHLRKSPNASGVPLYTPYVSTHSAVTTKNSFVTRSVSSRSVQSQEFHHFICLPFPMPS